MEVVERFGTLVLMVMILCVYKVSVDKVILNYSKSLVTQGVYLMVWMSESLVKHVA